jgi:hypothetical protein
VYARAKSYSDTNGEQWAPTATETQGDPSKGEVDEETIKAFKTECYKKELGTCSEDQKWMTARDKFKAKTGSYEGFVHHVTEDLQLTSYQETVKSIVETRRLQGQDCNTGPEAQDKTGTQGLLIQEHMNFTSSQYARTQGAPEAMSKFSPPRPPLVQMIISKEATELSQDSGYSPAPEAMVKCGQMSPPSHALASILSNKKIRTQDAPEAMLRIEDRTSISEPLWNILQTKAAKIGEQESTIMNNSDTIMHQERWTK